MSKELLDKIAEILDNQSSVFGTLTDLSRKKQEVLLTGDLGELEKLLPVEEALIYQAGKLEKARLSLTDQLAAAYDLKPEENTLSRITMMLDEPYSSTYFRLRRDLVEKIRQLQEINHQNTELLELSLHYIRFSLDLIGQGNGHQAYGPDGGRQFVDDATILDRKI